MTRNKHPYRETADLYAPNANVEMYALPPRLTMQQQAISLRIAAALLRHTEARNLGQVLHTPGGLAVLRQRIRPDVVFVSRRRRGIVGKTRLHAPPDLIVDVLSLPRQLGEFRIKKRLYAFYSVGEYWVADPEALTVEVMLWSEMGYVSIERYGRRKRLDSPMLPDLKLPVAMIFGMEGS